MLIQKNKQMKQIFTLSAIALSITLQAQHSLEKKWETDSTLKTPESVLFDAGNKTLYVSNIDGKGDEKDGSGSIGKVSLDGKIIATDWVPGLNAPKGLALVKNILWVADLDELVTIDITKGQITNHIKIPGAIFLNDVAADAKGNFVPLPIDLDQRTDFGREFEIDMPQFRAGKSRQRVVPVADKSQEKS